MSIDEFRNALRGLLDDAVMSGLSLLAISAALETESRAIGKKLIEKADRELHAK